MPSVQVRIGRHRVHDKNGDHEAQFKRKHFNGVQLMASQFIPLIRLVSINLPNRNPIMLLRGSTILLLLSLSVNVFSQDHRPSPELIRNALLERGIASGDIEHLRVSDAYTDARTGVHHTWFRQQWQGIDVFNSEVAVHQLPDGGLISLSHSLAQGLEKKAADANPGMDPPDALASVLGKDGISVPMPRITKVLPEEHTTRFAGTDFRGEEPFVQLMWLRIEEDIHLVWNVNYLSPTGDHWWNVRIDALTGEELERNDWIAHCALDTPGHHDHTCAIAPPAEPAAASLPAGPNDYNVFAMPLESPNHGARTLQNAPWLQAQNASPYGWHDTNGAPGAEFTITRGNNVHAQEDGNGNDGTGYSPDGGAFLDFDFPLNLANAPSTYQDAAITNLFYWNNVTHDVWYQYGFDDVSGNFQVNNYGQGGLGNDPVLADAQDGSGTNNANFGTPPDGSSPRMQMFIWNYTTPNTDSGLDNGIIVHEYGHGISNRLVGGPANVNCLGNSEQMGEGWSDYFGLMMTMQAGDAAVDPRGIGTYVLGQPTNGTGIRPAPYSTSFGVNNYTYASTNSGLSVPHGIGFAWCTMLWELTWDLIDQYGFDPDMYNGTGGNNIAMRLVTEGLKFTACNPGFVDGRNAILNADLVHYGGANQDLIWGAFARRGLGYSADQGSSSSRSDQVEAFDLPFANNVGIQAAVNPSPAGALCANDPVQVQIINSGLEPQGNFDIRYRVNAGDWVTETFTGTLASNATALFTFTTALPTLGPGLNTMEFATLLVADEYPQDDELSITLLEPVAPPYLEDLESALLTPPGWGLENPDQGITWTNSAVTNGPECESTQAWRINFYTYNNYGQEDRLISPPVDLSASAGSRLRFHQAHARYSNSYEDSLRVQVSSDCGQNWTTIWQVQGSSMATAANSTSNWAPANCGQWALRDLDLSAYDGQVVQFRFVAITGYGNNLYLDNIELLQNGVQLQLNVLLEGAYDQGSGLMRDDLRVAGSIPGTEPYTALGYAHTNGGGDEEIQAGVLTPTGEDAIVDWVIVELRDPAVPTEVIATRSALLQRDGDVVGMDGVSPLVFLITTGEYHVAVRHRNHLGCMILVPVLLDPTSPTVRDLSIAETATYGTDARKAVGDKLVLRAGDVDFNGELKYTGSGNDRDRVLQATGGIVPTATVSGYFSEDVNLDGTVKYTGSANDRDPILLNIGGVVPTATRGQQLP